MCHEIHTDAKLNYWAEGIPGELPHVTTQSFSGWIFRPNVH